MHRLKRQKSEEKASQVRDPKPKLVRTKRYAEDCSRRNGFVPSGICFAPRLGDFSDLVVVTSVANDSPTAFDKFEYKLSSKYQEAQELNKRFAFGTHGKAAGQFNRPSGVCVQPITNNLIVNEEMNHRAQVLAISSSTNDQQQPILDTLFVIGAGIGNRKLRELSGPTGVCCSNSGDIFVADTSNHRVRMYDRKGKIVRQVGANVDCKRSDAKDGFDRPWAVALEPTRHLGVPDRMLLVTDTGNQRLSLWDKDGQEHIANVAIEGRPRGVCVDLNGYIIVSSSTNTIQIFDPIKFERLQVIGTPIHRGSIDPGCFDYPAGLCVDDENNLYVCDQLNHRLQVF